MQSGTVDDLVKVINLAAFGEDKTMSCVKNMLCGFGRVGCCDSSVLVLN